MCRVSMQSMNLFSPGSLWTCNSCSLKQEGAVCSQRAESGCLPMEATSTIIRFDGNPGEQGSVQAQGPCSSPYGNKSLETGVPEELRDNPGV